MSSTVEMVDETTESTKNRDVLEGVGSLTPRQREVLALIGQGLSTAEIARRLFRTVKTVESHRLMLGKRLGARNRVELARIAIQAGLIDLDSPHAEVKSAFADNGLGIADSVSPTAVEAMALIEAGASAETSEEFLRTLVKELVAALGASAAIIIRSSTGVDAGSVVGWTERGELPAIRYAQAGAEDDGMILGEIRAIDGPPSVMLAQVSDMSVLRCETSILCALHGSRGVRLGTLVVLLKSVPEENRAVVQVLRMIAGRVAAELERMESENRIQHLQTLLESSSEGLGLWERDLRNDCTTWSSEVYRILGHEPDEVPPSRERFLSMVNAEDRNAVLEACDRAIGQCVTTTVRFRLTRADGAERLMTACYEPALDLTGQLCGILGTIRDITEA